MKLLSLRLRGAIGIYDGLGIDEVNIDFEKFESGTICVYGDNGAGKTTLIENLTPFRKLFSRPGGLANQFRLKDSCRDLHLELGPDRYRFLININAESGKIESYVYKNGEIMNVDGKEGSYNDIVYKLFGSPDLFASSLFMPQKRTPFSKLSPERREELFNLEGIQAKSKHAADQAKSLQAEISELTGRITQLQDVISGMSGIEENIKIANSIVESRKESIAAIEKRIVVLSAELSGLQEQGRAQTAIKSEIAAIDKTIQQLQLNKTDIGFELGKKLSELETEIGVTTTAIETQEKLLDPEKLARMRELVAKRAELTAELQCYVDAHGKHVQAITELSTARHDLEVTETKLLSESDKAEDLLTDARKTASLINAVPCQALASAEERELCSSCQFLVNAIAAEKNIPTLERTAKEKDEAFRSTSETLKAKVATAEKFVADNPFDEAGAKACKAEVAAIDAQKPVDYIQRAEVAETKLAGLREKLTDLKDRHSKIEAEKADKVAMIIAQLEERAAERLKLVATIDDSLFTKEVSKQSEIDRARYEERADRDQLMSVQKDLDQYNERLGQRAEAEGKLSSCQQLLHAQESNQADWIHLSQMLSRNGGFQSYLIETSAVEMTEFANELLKGYDVPWTISIATSTDTADGKGKKDGFFVFVDTPTGQRELGDLSGGQAVWIDTILQHAVAYVQQRLSGKKLLTKILDEADGALDEERAIAYLNAIQAAHEQTGMWHTIMISHRPEIQNMISQRIHFKRNQGIEIELD